jgi:uncharacterized protein (UPF0548 family)
MGAPERRVGDRCAYGPEVILVRRPTPERVEAYRQARLHVDPTAFPQSEPPSGFHHDIFDRVVGSGPDDFGRARRGLEQWAAHRGSAVDVLPDDAPLAPGSTVAIVTRQLGLWVLAACRIESVIDEPGSFGFIYATLPDHPECGYESFVVANHGEDVVFTIEAVSRPGIPLVRFGQPVTRLLQQRATDAYLAALQTFVEDTVRYP